MNVCTKHDETNVECVSGGSGWSEYRCPKCAALFYMNWDDRWDGPVGVLILIRDERGQPARGACIADWITRTKPIPGPGEHARLAAKFAPAGADATRRYKLRINSPLWPDDATEDDYRLAARLSTLHAMGAIAYVTQWTKMDQKLTDKVIARRNGSGGPLSSFGCARTQRNR